MSVMCALFSMAASWHKNFEGMEQQSVVQSCQVTNPWPIAQLHACKLVLGGISILNPHAVGKQAPGTSCASTRCIRITDLHWSIAETLRYKGPLSLLSNRLAKQDHQSQPTMLSDASLIFMNDLIKR